MKRSNKNSEPKNALKKETKDDPVILKGPWTRQDVNIVAKIAATAENVSQVLVWNGWEYVPLVIPNRKPRRA